MRRSLVIGNWKMNGSQSQLHGLLSELKQVELDSSVEVAICPVSLYLNKAKQLLEGSDIKLGAQNVASYSPGAYTGEISACMLSGAGVEFCVVGHSERRAYFGETDEDVATKAIRCLAEGVCPVICVGESLEHREASQTLKVIEQQINTVVAVLNPEQLSQVVFAYEPVWAIGTGLTASPAQAQEVHELIRHLIANKSEEAAHVVRLLYGGSVKADNAAELFSQPDIDGGLIGGASLKADSFAAIINSAG